jgi:hypothetical protein
MNQNTIWWLTTCIGGLNAAGAAVLTMAATQNIHLAELELLAIGAFVAFTGYILGQTHSSKAKDTTTTPGAEQ